MLCCIDDSFSLTNVCSQSVALSQTDTTLFWFWGLQKGRVGRQCRSLSLDSAAVAHLLQRWLVFTLRSSREGSLSAAGLKRQKRNTSLRDEALLLVSAADGGRENWADCKHQSDASLGKLRTYWNVLLFTMNHGVFYSLQCHWTCTLNALPLPAAPSYKRALLCK